MIKLVKNTEEAVKGAEIELEKFWTPPFIPFSFTIQSVKMMEELEKKDMSELDQMDKLADLVTKIYGNQFSKEDLYNRLHAPDAITELQSQVFFIARGEQTDETKKFLKEKKS